MSAFGLEGAPYLFSQTGTFPAPYTFTVPATLEVRTDMASASFDGSGASGSWLPAVSFYSPSGVRLGTFPCQGTPLAMGASAEVTWFPLGLAASSAAAPSGGASSYFAIDGAHSSLPTSPHPQELLFTPSFIGDFNASDGTFALDATAGIVQITRPGGYFIVATVHADIRSEATALEEIYNVTLREVGSSSDIYGNGGVWAPTLSAVTQRSLLPGSSGTPALQFLMFFDVADDSPGGPYTFPLEIHLFFDWSAAATHDIQYYMSGFSVVAGTSAPGSGIQFDTFPQAGDWLYVETGDRTGSPFGRAFEVHDTSAGGTSGIEIRSDTSEIDIDAGDQLGLSSGSNMILLCQGALDISTANASSWTAQDSIVVDVDGDVAVRVQANGESFNVQKTGGLLTIRCFGDGRVSMPRIPTAAGAAGELYVDALGFVKRA